MVSRHLTHAPLFDWRNLFDSFKMKVKSDIELSEPWRKPGDKDFWFSRTSWSFLAIAILYKKLKDKSSITIWVPDFFCNASLQELRIIKANLKFYPINEQMSPDWNACQTLVNKSKPDLFVLVHYFGKPSSAERANEFCLNNNVWLIEDSAHVLRPDTGIGEYGDFILYSPHKYLPIPDGALLSMRKNGPSNFGMNASILENFQNIYFTLLKTQGFSNISSIIWLIKRIVQSSGIRFGGKDSTPFSFDDTSNHLDHSHPRMSPLSKRLLSIIVNNLDSVAIIRRQNCMIWKNLFAESSFIKTTSFSKSNDYTPYLFGLFFQDSTTAEQVFLKLQNAGLPVTTWPDLPPELSETKEYYGKSIFFRQTRIYLPVHQSFNMEKAKKTICNLQLKKNV